MIDDTIKKYNQIILPLGKEDAIRTIFEHFNYVALGSSNSNDGRKGFTMPTSEDNFLTDCGFNEIDPTSYPTYDRIELLEAQADIVPDEKGRVTLSFTCEIDTTNLSQKEMVTINQMAITDNQSAGDLNSRVFYAAVFPDFEKNGTIAIEFTARVTL